MNPSAGRSVAARAPAGHVPAGDVDVGGVEPVERRVDLVHPVDAGGHGGSPSPVLLSRAERRRGVPHVKTQQVVVRLRRRADRRVDQTCPATITATAPSAASAPSTRPARPAGAATGSGERRGRPPEPDPGQSQREARQALGDHAERPGVVGRLEEEEEQGVAEDPPAHQAHEGQAQSHEGPRAGALVGRAVRVLREACVVLLGHGGSPSIMAAPPRPPWGEG